MEIVRQGDLIWIDAEPHAGREQGGHNPQKGNIRRPMLVISTSQYYRNTGLIIGMPITHKKYSRIDILIPLEDPKSGINGSVITYQMQNFDFQARHGKIVGKVSHHFIQQILPIAVGAFGIDL